MICLYVLLLWHSVNVGGEGSPYPSPPYRIPPAPPLLSRRSQEEGECHMYAAQRVYVYIAHDVQLKEAHANSISICH